MSENNRMFDTSDVGMIEVKDPRLLTDEEVKRLFNVPETVREVLKRARGEIITHDAKLVKKI